MRIDLDTELNDEMISVLHVITGLSTGGAERMLLKLILETKNQLNHSVISLTDVGTQGRKLQQQGITVHTLNMNSIKRLPLTLIFLKRIINELNPDVMHAWMYHANVVSSLALMISFRKSRPLIHSIRHSLHHISHEKRTTQWMIRLNALLSKFAERIVYNSNTSQLQHEHFGFSPDKSLLIPNGFNVEEYFCDENKKRIAKGNLSIQSDSMTFLQIGRNHPMKNHQLFLKAARIFTERINFNIKPTFILVGRDVTNDKNLILLKTLLDPIANVLLLDEVSDPIPYYCAADVFTLTSSWGEAFPNVLGEAMACGLPCITTNVGDSVTIVGETGLVVEPNDVDAFSKAMVSMVKLNSKQRHGLGNIARKRISENYSISVIAIQYHNLYVEMNK